MLSISGLAETAALVGEPGRTAMLVTLLDGRALTAGELARAAGVTPQTASGHLGKMLEAGLLALEAQGRHRYYRLASSSVAGFVRGRSRTASDRRHRDGSDRRATRADRGSSLTAGRSALPT